MLTARRKTGELFSLADFHNREFIRQYRQKEEFYCPECNQKVILKIGNKKVAHFSHQKDQLCSREYYERESNYHLSGKITLYHWLKKQGLQPELEPYLPEIQQRPDILFCLDHKKYALEFQCSAISEQIFRKRTESYLQRNLIPFWLLGANHFNRKTASLASVSSFHYLFMKKLQSTWAIPLFCADTNQLLYLHSIAPLSARNAMFSFSANPLRVSIVDDLLLPKLISTFSSSEWRKKLEYFKQQLILNPRAHMDPFLRELYQNDLNASLLPPEIGLPVRHSPFIETSPLIWQGYIWLDLRHINKSNKQFSFSQIYASIKDRVRNQQIKIRSFPLVEKGHHSFAVWDYLCLLTKIGVLLRIDRKTFQIRKLEVPENSLQKVHLDEVFYQKYEKVIERNLLG